MRGQVTDQSRSVREQGAMDVVPVLDIRNLRVVYPVTRRSSKVAVDDLSFTIAEGETLGLVGESGSGKSSVARAVLQLPPPTSGKVYFSGEDLTVMSRQRLRQIRPQLQIVFQESTAALNPRRRIGKSIGIVLASLPNGSPQDSRHQVAEMLEQVGLNPATYDRKPYELSGGQCQRVQIARALISRPKLLILDEPVSSLDVSVQAQILNLLGDLRRRYGLTQLFISHDLAVVRHVCDRVAVMYKGKLCELAPADDLYSTPVHPYTVTLLSAIPRLVFRESRLHSSPFHNGENHELQPSPGCRFSSRCPEAEKRCLKVEPPLRQITPGHFVACHHAGRPE